MKIRTITAGIKLSNPMKDSKVTNIIDFLKKARERFESFGSVVQSVRLSTQPWNEYTKRLEKEEIIENICQLENLCKENEIDFISIGTTNKLDSIDIIPEIIKETSITSCSVTINNKENGTDFDSINKSAEVIFEISRTTDKGIGNFNFAGIINCPPDIPFFPASYHKGEPCFSIGTESGDLIVKAFSTSKNFKEAKKNLRQIFQVNFREIEKISKSLGNANGISFKGIDLSPAPSLLEEESIAFAFEKLLGYKFGAPGTLAIAEMITGVLKSLDIKRCGYSGLMLPILEDAGLSKRYKEKTFNIGNLLEYSTVCGTGLDCIPLPGDISIKEIAGILLDVVTLSNKLSKPLSARLLPYPGKKAGDMTDFKSPYLVDTMLRNVSHN